MRPTQRRVLPDIALRSPDPSLARLCELPIEFSIAAVALAVPLVVVPSWTIPFDVPQMNLLKAATGLAITFAALRWGLLRLSSSPGTRLAPPVAWAAAAFGAVLVASTVASISPEVSFWGNYPDQHGTSALNQLCFLALAIVVGCAHWRPEPRTRVAAYLAAGGAAVALYGIVQFGWGDPLGLARPGGRIISTLGNPIFVGDLLVTTTTFTAALTATSFSRMLSRPARPHLGRPAQVGRGFVTLRAALGPYGCFTTLAFLALVVQLAALLLTQSRGPFLGLAVALLVSLAVLTWAGGPRRALTLVAILLVASLTALALVRLLPGGGAATLGVSAQRVANVGQFAAASLPAGDTAEAAPPELASETFLPHLRTWQMGWDLALHRPWVSFRPDAPYPIRALLGYGPDTSRIVNRMGAPPDLLRLHPGQISYYMHNLPLQILSDLGWLGLLAFCTLLTLALHRLYLALHLTRGIPTSVREPAAALHASTTWITAAAAGALFGHLAEQLTGVPVSSADAAFWLTLGLALGAIRPASRSAPARYLRWQPPTLLALPGLALLLIAGMSVSAEIRASQAVRALDAGNAAAGERLLKEATEVAPWPPYYQLLMGAMYSNAAPNMADPAVAGRLTNLAGTYLDAVLRQDPWNVTARSVRAWTHTILGVNDPAHRDIARRRYDEIIALAPNFDEPVIQYANALIVWGEPDAALALLDDRLRNTSANPIQAVLLRARAHHTAGRLDQAIEAVEAVMRRGSVPPDVDALHTALLNERAQRSR